MTEVAFQRARSPEQQQLRREAVLAAARAMLDELTPAQISLRELSQRVGLSKSNVVRYFPSREAIFLTVLVEDWRGWLDAVELALPRNGAQRSASGWHRAMAGVLAETLVARPRLCDLLVVCQTVLEHNIPLETAREFKQAMLALVTRLSAIVRDRSGGDLDERAAFEFAGLVWIVVAGARPMATPSPIVAEVLLDPELAPLCVGFGEVMTTALSALLDGLSKR